MHKQQTPKNKSFENMTSFLIVAVVVGTAIILPAGLWIAGKFGWQLPAPVQKLLESLGFA